VETPEAGVGKTGKEGPDPRRREMKLSARNLIKGKVTKIEEGAVNSVVTLEIPGGAELVSVITISSVERLGLAVGKEAYAMIKASNVMIAVDD
jgi:molybdopterin-binding protein